MAFIAHALGADLRVQLLAVCIQKEITTNLWGSHQRVLLPLEDISVLARFSNQSHVSVY